MWEELSKIDVDVSYVMLMGVYLCGRQKAVVRVCPNKVGLLFLSSKISCKLKKKKKHHTALLEWSMSKILTTDTYTVTNIITTPITIPSSILCAVLFYATFMCITYVIYH